MPLALVYVGDTVYTYTNSHVYIRVIKIKDVRLGDAYHVRSRLVKWLRNVYRKGHTATIGKSVIRLNAGFIAL